MLREHQLSLEQWLGIAELKEKETERIPKNKWSCLIEEGKSCIYSPFNLALLPVLQQDVEWLLNPSLPPPSTVFSRSCFVAKNLCPISTSLNLQIFCTNFFNPERNAKMCWSVATLCHVPLLLSYVWRHITAQTVLTQEEIFSIF